MEARAYSPVQRFAISTHNGDCRYIDINIRLLTSPNIRLQFWHGNHSAATADLRFHLRVCANPPILTLLRRDQTRHGTELAGHGAQAHLESREKRPAHPRLDRKSTRLNSSH